MRAGGVLLMMRFPVDPQNGWRTKLEIPTSGLRKRRGQDTDFEVNCIDERASLTVAGSFLRKNVHGAREKVTWSFRGGIQ